MPTQTTHPSFWSTSTGRALRWILLIPVGLGAITLGDVIVTLGVEWIASWSTRTIIIAALFGVFPFLIGLFIYIPALVGIMIGFLAPNVKAGIMILGTLFSLVFLSTISTMLGGSPGYLILEKIVYGAIIYWGMWQAYHDEIDELPRS